MVAFPEIKNYTACRQPTTSSNSCKDKPYIHFFFKTHVYTLYFERVKRCKYRRITIFDWQNEPFLKS